MVICHEKSMLSIYNFYSLRFEEQREVFPKILVKIGEIAMPTSFLLDLNVWGWLIHMQTIHKGNFYFRGLSKYHDIKTQ